MLITPFMTSVLHYQPIMFDVFLGLTKTRASMVRFLYLMRSSQNNIVGVKCYLIKSIL